MTNAQFVSRVINGLNSVNKDDHISRRYILGIGQDKSKFYISQKLLDKSLFREDNLFRNISCFQLKEENTIKCGIYEFARCKSLMKSVKKIPSLIYSRYGASIISITTLDGNQIFEPITMSAFRLFKDRKDSDKFKQKIKHYYIKDSRLYLPDSEIEAVNILYIPFQEIGLDEVSTCGDLTPCKSAWDMEFIVPDKLLEQVITETIAEVSRKKSIPTDENPNGDSNIKSSTTK